MQLEAGGKKFKIWSNIFCRLCNRARDLQGARKGTLQVRKKPEKTTLKAHQLDGQLWADEPTVARLNNFAKPVNSQNIEEVPDDSDEDMIFEDEDYYCTISVN